MKQFTNNFKLKANGVTEASLCTPHTPHAPNISLTVVQGTDGIATLTTLEDIPTGVWNLRIKAACGCFSQLVYTLCPPPHIPGIYNGNGGTPTPAPSCT